MAHILMHFVHRTFTTQRAQHHFFFLLLSLTFKPIEFYLLEHFASAHNRRSDILPFE